MVAKLCCALLIAEARTVFREVDEALCPSEPSNAAVFAERFLAPFALALDRLYVCAGGKEGK